MLAAESGGLHRSVKLLFLRNFRDSFQGAISPDRIMGLLGFSVVVQKFPVFLSCRDRFKVPAARRVQKGKQES